MSTKRKVNIQLFRRMQRWLLKHGDQFEMDWWYDWHLHLNSNQRRPPGGCGTTACLAGLAVHLASKRKTLRETSKWGNGFTTPRLARQLLGIDGEQSDALFVTEGWKPEFQERYNRATTPRQRARAAIAQIDWFIDNVATPKKG